MRNDIRRGRHNITASVAQAIQDINRNFVNGNFEDVCSVVGLYKQPGFDPMVLVHWGDLEESDDDALEWIQKENICGFSSIEGDGMEEEKIVVFWGLNTSSTLTTSTAYVGKIQMKDALIEEDAGLQARQHKVMYVDGDSEVIDLVSLEYSQVERKTEDQKRYKRIAWILEKYDSQPIRQKVEDLFAEYKSVKAKRRRSSNKTTEDPKKKAKAKRSTEEKEENKDDEDNEEDELPLSHRVRRETVGKDAAQKTVEAKRRRSSNKTTEVTLPQP